MKNGILFFDLWQFNCKIKTKIKIVRMRKEKKFFSLSSSLFFNKLINRGSSEFLSLFWSRHLSIKEKSNHVIFQRRFINQRWRTSVAHRETVSWTSGPATCNFSRRVDKTQGNNWRAGSSRYLPRSQIPLCFRMVGAI